MSDANELERLNAALQNYINTAQVTRALEQDAGPMTTERAHNLYELRAARRHRLERFAQALDQFDIGESETLEIVRGH